MVQVLVRRGRSCMVRTGNHHRSGQRYYRRSRRVNSSYPVANSRILCWRCSHRKCHLLLLLHQFLRGWVILVQAHQLLLSLVSGLLEFLLLLHHRWCNRHQKQPGIRHHNDRECFHTSRMTSSRFRGRRCFEDHISSHHCWVHICRRATDQDRPVASGRLR